jgi:NADPH:quinone reductase-like Zn-dependent oxidoreductase
MRAFVYDGAFASWSTSVAKPALEGKAGSVLVQTRAVSLNPIDYKKPGLPVIGWGLKGTPVAQDFAGVVIESSSSSFVAGDEVYGRASGCLAEFLLTDSGAISRKPVSVTFEEAASLPTVGLTSMQALAAVGAKTGSKIIVTGASGGCGSIGLQLARYLIGPSGKLAAICGTANVEFVRSLAPSALILDYKRPESIVGADSALKADAPWDGVYDTVSSELASDSLAGQPYDAALRPFLKSGGVVAAINGNAGRWVQALTGLGIFSPGYRLIFMKDSPAQLAELAALVDGGHVRPMIDPEAFAFTAEGCEAAYAKLKSRRARGKIVITVA